jgi:phosphoglycolate phosphatase-like HAD superfamily hydrolase
MKKIKYFIWDVDGTLCNSFKLAFNSTNIILKKYDIKEEITEKEYHEGSRFTTPKRLAWHLTKNPDDEIGIKLGIEFDNLYISLISIETTPFFKGIKELLIHYYFEKNIKFGAYSNANTLYVKSVLSVNNVIDLFDIYLGI